MSVDYSDGGVHALTMGGAELHTLLSSAARLSQLVLVDFSASWCGPCRMITPVLHQLATEHRGRLVVVKVDCEQTPANRELAAASSIGAFPTFHLYRAQQKVAELRGADQAGLRRLIQQQLPLLSRPAGGGGVKSPLVAALLAALGRVKQGCSYAEFVTAVKTLLAFVGNCLANPSDQKYRRIKLSNPAYQSRLGCRAGGKDCLAAIGFREMMEAGEPVMMLIDIPPELQEIHNLLRQALQNAEAGAAAATAAERRAVAVAPAAAAPAAAVPAVAVPAVAAPADTAPTAAAPTDAERKAALAPSMAAAAQGPAATAGTGAPTAGRPAAADRAQRLSKVTPEQLAAMLARAMQASGIAGTPVAAAHPLPARREQQAVQQAEQREAEVEGQHDEEQRQTEEAEQQSDDVTPPAADDDASK
ncbi:hypothetical protein D9Q98_007862 [Chlorella vulgaris]|uniref:Thioredoxin domain-containing protein n=1 Tax=Chlorella vulgaris TaxID=3077 RepID=A0A9D4THQ2_CHLVU|nr:hypothetical protein D9Q98_007862 [Chlorella vulgaris]